MNNNMTTRLIEVMGFIGVNQNVLSKIAEHKGNSRVSHMIKNGSAIPSDLLRKLKLHAPEINLNYIITGEGTPLINNYTETAVNNVAAEPITSYRSSIKMVGLKQQGLYTENYNYDAFLKDLPSINKELNSSKFRDFECLASIPALHVFAGDVLRCSLIDVNNLFSKGVSKALFAVAVATGNIIIGEITSNHDLLTIKSNRTTTSVPREDIAEIWEVKYIITPV